MRSTSANATLLTFEDWNGMSDNSEYVASLVRAIIESGELKQNEWQEFSLVCSFAPSGINQSYGYSYSADGNWEAFSVRPRLIREQADSYRQWLSADKDQPIIKLLLQFNRESRDFNIDLEYDDQARWQVTPNNLDRVIEALRPNLSAKSIGRS
jgi:hypothetical protein